MSEWLRKLDIDEPFFYYGHRHMLAELQLPLGTPIRLDDTTGALILELRRPDGAILVQLLLSPHQVQEIHGMGVY